MTVLLSFEEKTDDARACAQSGHCPFKVPNKDLGNYDGDGKENVKKATGLMSKTTTLHVHHAFLFISLLSLHNYYVKWPNFNFT